MLLQIILDMRYFLIILVVITVGASFLYFGLSGKGGDALGDNYLHTLLHMYESFVLGTYETSNFDGINQPVIGHVFFVFLSLFTLIIQLNLLIALMTDSFEKIKE